MNAKKIVAAFFILVVLLLAVAGIVWASGFIFFAVSKANPLGKTDFLTWWTYWQAYKGDPVVSKRLLLSLLIPTVVVFGAIGAAIYMAMRDRRTLYGEARFSHEGEMEKAGLFGKNGIIVGKCRNRYLMFDGPQFVLLAAPTRSGKGVGIVIPNLLNWSQSVVVLDVKGENFLITSGVRARYGSRCFIFNPFATDGKTHRYNPLGYISDNPDLRVTEILAIGYSLYPGEGKDNFFDDAARNLFLGLTLYLCETPDLPRTIGELLRQSSGKNGMPVKEYLQSLIESRNFREVTTEGEEGEPIIELVPITEWDGQGHPPLSSQCVDAINRFTSTSDNTLSSIMATFNVPLTLWASPICDAATSANDFDLRKVREQRMSIYLAIPANKMAESELILNLFFTQLINLNTEEQLGERPEIKYTCLLLMDEFTAPGRIGNIDKANAYMAGYGLRLLTIIQSPGQLMAEPRRGYGREGARTLMTNHALQILYAPREQQDANEYSEMLGNETFKSTSRSRQLSGRSGASESVSDQKRPLMLPQELKEMSLREQIVILENVKPFKCEKIAYYNDPVFMNRLKAISPSLQAFGEKYPDAKQFGKIWGSGELAAPVTPLDFGLHRAVVERRMRDMTPADAENVELKRVAVDLTAVGTAAASASKGEGLTAEQTAVVVDEFFGAFEGGWAAADGGEVSEGEDATDVDEDGSEPPISAEELAALDAQVAREAAEQGIVLRLNVGPMVVNLDVLDDATDETPAVAAADGASGASEDVPTEDDADDAQAADDGIDGGNSIEVVERYSDDDLAEMFAASGYTDDASETDYGDYPDDLIAESDWQADEGDSAGDEAAAPHSASSTLALDLSVIDRP